MPTETELLRKDLKELAGHVGTLAKAILKKNDTDYEDEDDLDKQMGGFDQEEQPVDPMAMDQPDPMMPEDPNMMDKHGAGGEGEYDDPMAAMPGEEEEQYDDFEMAYKAMKALQTVKKNRLARKGYAASAKTKADEHDAPFGDKDSTDSGNEPQEAGAQGGDREDETFGPGGMAYRKMRLDLNRAMATINELTGGVTVTKAFTPPGKTANRRPEESASGDAITRDMQTQAKDMTFKELCKFREDVGDLPRHLIG